MLKYLKAVILKKVLPIIFWIIFSTILSQPQQILKYIHSLIPERMVVRKVSMVQPLVLIKTKV